MTYITISRIEIRFLFYGTKSTEPRQPVYGLPDTFTQVFDILCPPPPPHITSDQSGEFFVFKSGLPAADRK